jgi:thiamine kinase
MQRSEQAQALYIAAECLGVAPASIAAPVQIKNGLTNESWLVRSDAAAVVVRLSNRETAALQIDRNSEAAILAVVATADIGAPVLLCDPQRHVLVTRYLPGRVWTARDARQAQNLERIAFLLRTLHALPLPDQAQYVDLWKIVRSYWDTLMARGLSARTGSSEVRERARQLITQLSADAQLCLCHNDVHHLNVIDSAADQERLWLIDWEYAGVGDPYFDLASVCCYHALSDAARRELLLAYLGYFSVASFDRLQRMCWVFNYIRDLWFAVREME